MVATHTTFGMVAQGVATVRVHLVDQIRARWAWLVLWYLVFFTFVKIGIRSVRWSLPWARLRLCLSLGSVSGTQNAVLRCGVFLVRRKDSLGLVFDPHVANE